MLTGLDDDDLFDPEFEDVFGFGDDDDWFDDDWYDDGIFSDDEDDEWGDHGLTCYDEWSRVVPCD